MSETFRSVEGELKVLQSDNDFIFPVELWLLNDKVNRNNWQFINLEQHRAEWAGVPILVAYVNGGRTTGDGHNQTTRVDKNGEEYQSFTAATAERIAGALSDDPNDVRLEKVDGTTWVVASGFLWAWYSHELCLQIADWAQQGRSMSVSIEALVTDSHMDGNVEVETSYIPLGVTVLGEGVAPAVPDAHIAMLTEIESEFKELKLRAASYLEQDNAPKSQETKIPEKKELKRRMRLSKQQLRELQAKFGDDYTVLSAEQGEAGTVTVALMSQAGATAIYTMESLEDGVYAERIQAVNAQAHFCAEDGTEVCVDASDLVEAKSVECASLSTRLETAETALAQANATVEQMVTAENARRLSAAKAKALATLEAFNAHRTDKVDAKVLEALTADIEAGKFTACADESGAWVGETLVEKEVKALCADAVMELDAKRAKTEQPMTWGDVKKASAAPGTVGELFASKKH